MRDFYDSMLSDYLRKQCLYCNSEEDLEQQEKAQEEKEERKNRHKIFSGGGKKGEKHDRD